MLQNESLFPDFLSPVPVLSLESYLWYYIVKWVTINQIDSKQAIIWLLMKSGSKIHCIIVTKHICLI